MEKLFRPKKDIDGNWIACDGTILPQTESGKASINADALRSMVHPASDIILKIRKQMRCRDTFLKRHVLGHVHNNYLHPNINQVKGDNGGTGTGRLSYTRPALQQIPARDKDVAAIMRPIFIPDDEQLWACMDYEQFEFRMFAHYVNDPDIIKLYADDPNVDFHQIVADMTGLPRNAPMSGGPNAKQLNLSMIYDMGEASIARTLNMPLDPDIKRFTDKDGNEIAYQKAGPEAQRIIEKYHNAIPGVRLLYEKVKSVGKTRGFVTSMAGRKMRYPKGKGLNKAKAILCQGSSADCMKQKIIELHDYFQTIEGCRMYISVHDEINIGIPEDPDKHESILKDVRHILESFDTKPFKLRVPIKTDLGVGSNWAEASGKGG
jgi:DNA polymerase I-like protein with 3'-5' exonuclease and polymerase domains